MMDCREVQKWIDEMPADKNFEPKEAIVSHLRNCTACQKYYDDHRRMIRLVSNLRNQQPELKSADTLTAAILSSVEKEQKDNVRRVFPMVFLIRFLAAATVVLLVTLGVEQYSVLRKVQHLEVQLGKAMPAPAPQVKLYRSSLVDLDAVLSGADQDLSLKKMLLLLQMKRFANSDFTYRDLNRTMSRDSLEHYLHLQQQKHKKQKP